MNTGESLNIQNNLCWLYKVPNNILMSIKEEIDVIKNDFLSHEKDNARNDLAGNIKHEYYLKNNHKLIEEMVIEQINSWNVYTGNRILGVYETYVMNPLPLKMKNFWVNFQKKYEFNPIHDHSGLFSFVIWYDIPYSIEDERNRLPNGHNNLCGQFSFITSTPFRGVESCNIPVDKSYNGTMAIFRASTHHAVYPFYTSDDYRVTVSGNIRFNNEDT